MATVPPISTAINPNANPARSNAALMRVARGWR